MDYDCIMKNDDILNILFTSKARVGVLKVLYASKKEMKEAEIIFKVGLPRSTVVHEIQKLYNVGLLSKRQTATRTFYELNKDFIFANELRSLFKHS